MRVAKVRLADGSTRLCVVEYDTIRLLDLTQADDCRSLADILHSDDPPGLAQFLIDPRANPIRQDEVKFLAPIDKQEVWAAGVTYKRSQVARMEESKAGASHYDKVYSAPRPEIFFKATRDRVSGPREAVRVRADSNWSVPEPEFTLVVSPELKIVGYTIGNDMSARDIEGENPLYLPQAKCYRQCCALGPCIKLVTEPLDKPATVVKMMIYRNHQEVFWGETNLGQLNREPQELVDWLGRDNVFPHGAFLMTGTGVVPPNEFTLIDNDWIVIEITNVGRLETPVVKGPGK
jgi:2-dehydro-3-deoxy-D-arabinonate dehydratase